MTDTEKEYRKIIYAYKALFSSANGKVVFEDMCKRSLNRSSFVPGDPYSTAYYEGQRAWPLRIRYYLENDADQILKKVQPVKAKSIFSQTMDEEEITDGERL